MRKIVVYHPQNAHIDGGSSTIFTGERLTHAISAEGELTISDWHTETEQGEATFARGQWTYVCISRPYRQ